MKLTPGFNFTNPLPQVANAPAYGIWCKRCHSVSPTKQTHQQTRLVHRTRSNAQLFLYHVPKNRVNLLGQKLIMKGSISPTIQCKSQMRQRMAYEAKDVIHFHQQNCALTLLVQRVRSYAQRLLCTLYVMCQKHRVNLLAQKVLIKC